MMGVGKSELVLNREVVVVELVLLILRRVWLMGGEISALTPRGGDLGFCLGGLSVERHMPESTSSSPAIPTHKLNTLYTPPPSLPIYPQSLPPPSPAAPLRLTPPPSLTLPLPLPLPKPPSIRLLNPSNPSPALPSPTTHPGTLHPPHPPGPHSPLHAIPTAQPTPAAIALPGNAESASWAARR